jgi:guanine nucleotide-binding protein G(i) subunit alpha
MGACQSDNSIGVTKEEKQRTKQIDEELKRDRKLLESEIKLLLLGAGESGKSTIAKQMRIIHLNGFTDDEKKSFIPVIHSNIISSMKTLLEAAQKFNYDVAQANKEAESRLLNLNKYPFVLTEQLVKDIKDLWADTAIQKTFQRSNEFQLLDSAPYYFANVERIGQANYVPDVQDILRSRSKTTGITEIEFEYKGTKFRLVDVGGQRSERKKWIHCFQDVTAVIFCVALSEYDLKLYEDENVNRMKESLQLFGEICNSKWFQNVNIILFLNKNDLFKEKIRKVDLKVCFSEYAGGCDYDKAIEFIKEKFIEMNKNPTKQIYLHITCATDTENIRFVFNAVRDILLQKAMNDTGF